MSKKFTQLPVITTPAETDILALVPSGGDTSQITTGKLLTVPHSSNAVYDPIVIPASQMKQDATDKPDFDYTNVGLVFDPGLDEAVNIVVEMPHSWFEGSSIVPKGRWVQSSAGNVVWQIEYKWTNRGAIAASGFTTVSASTAQYSWSSGDLNNTTAFAAIAGTAMTVGSTLQIILTRLGANGSDTYATDALLTQLDIMIQHDGKGTRQEYTK